MRILITGASGFIGAHLVKHLSAGHEITAFSRTPRKIIALAHPNVRVVQGLLEDFPLVAQLVRNQDAVIHCALGWGTTAVEMLQRDTLPAIHLFERAIAAGVKKIIDTSSSVAVGEYRAIMDEDTVCRPLDYYSATKSAVEGYLLAQSRTTDTECNIVRPIYTFGHPAASGCATQPDQRFWSFARDAIENRPIRLIKNDGTQFIWVGHLVRLYEHFLRVSCTRTIINAGSDFQHSWESIASAVVSRLRSSSEIVLEDLGWQANGSICSNAKMKAILPEAADCSTLLQDHINYVCDISLARALAANREGVLA
jgi:nucleoside-diphosphate-sugar epimerase